MPRVILRVEATAVRAERDGKVVWGGGVVLVRAGEWLVDAHGYGLAALSDAEVAKLPRMLGPADAEERLRVALETGTL